MIQIKAFYLNILTLKDAFLQFSHKKDWLSSPFSDSGALLASLTFWLLLHFTHLISLLSNALFSASIEANFTLSSSIFEEVRKDLNSIVKLKVFLVS